MKAKKASLDMLNKAGQSANMVQTENRLREISLSSLHNNPFQPRLNIDDESVKELANSIDVSGLLQPIIVAKREEGGYFIVSGHRRAEACKRLGKESINAIIKDANESVMKINALVENIQRENLQPLEVALCLKDLSESGVSHEEISKKIGKGRVYVTKTLSILNLNEQILQDIPNHDKLDVQALYLLQKIKDTKLQLNTYKKYISKEISREDINDILKKQKTKKITKPLFKVNKGVVSLKIDLTLLQEDELESFVKRLYEEHKKVKK